MFDLKYLDLYDKVTVDDMFLKLVEEMQEVELELIKPVTTDCDLAGELLDVMQCCLGIAYTNNIDLKKYVNTHNVKLLSRRHKFISKEKESLSDIFEKTRRRDEVLLDMDYGYSDDYN